MCWMLKAQRKFSMPERLFSSYVIDVKSFIMFEQNFPNPKMEALF